MDLDIEEVASLALFARVVSARSFTAAAAASGLTKSAVSRRVAALESRLGVKLLRRTTRKLAVTPEGLRVYGHAVRLLEETRAAREVVLGASQEMKGLVRVNGPVDMGQQHLAAAFAAFLLRHPEVEIELDLDNRLVDVIEGGYDLVIRVGRLTASSLVARRLAVDRMVVCGSPAYLARTGRPETPDQLVHHNCLHYQLMSWQAEWRFRRDRSEEAVPVGGNFTSSDGNVLCAAARAGLGLVVVPYFMVACDVAHGRLQLLLEGGGVQASEIGVYAVTAPGRQQPRRVRSLVDHLVRWFARADWQSRAGEFDAPASAAALKARTRS